MALTLNLVPWNKGGGSPVLSDQGSSDSGAYLIDSIEYIPATKLPSNSLFDDPEELAELLEDTKTSIEDRGSAAE